MEDHPAAAATTEPAKVDPGRKIVIEVIALKNCRVVGPSVEEMDYPDKPRETLRFEIEGIEAGDAELLVEARQGAGCWSRFRSNPASSTRKPNGCIVPRR